MQGDTIMRKAFIFLSLLSITATASAASFDCSKASLPDEKTICADRRLNDLDVEIATKYRFLAGLFGMGARDSMRDAQAEWLKSRQACKSDKECLIKSYTKKNNDLNAIYDNINKPL